MHRLTGWRPWAIPRPTGWAFLRVMVLGTLGGWLLPLPWQQVTAQPPGMAPSTSLGPAAIEWVRANPGFVGDEPAPPR